jgi:hypothetical protein
MNLELLDSWGYSQNRKERSVCPAGAGVLGQTSSLGKTSLGIELVTFIIFYYPFSFSGI